MGGRCPSWYVTVEGFKTIIMRRLKKADGRESHIDASISGKSKRSIVDRGQVGALPPKVVSLTNPITVLPSQNGSPSSNFEQQVQIEEVVISIYGTPKMRRF